MALRFFRHMAQWLEWCQTINLLIFIYKHGKLSFQISSDLKGRQAQYWPRYLSPVMSLKEAKRTLLIKCRRSATSINQQFQVGSFMTGFE